MSLPLSRFSRTTRNSLPPRVIVHGPQGIGKSTFAASAYNPVFLAFEDGLSGIEVDAWNEGRPIKTWAETKEAFAALRDADYGTVVLDSLDWLEGVIHAEIAKRNGKNAIDEIAYGKGFGEALILWGEVINELDWLRANKGMASILIAHTQVKRFESPESEPWDRFELKCHKNASAKLVEYADIVGFAHEETAIKKENNGFNVRTRGISTGRRLLRVVGSAAVVAKNRYDLPEVLPLEWNALMAAMNPAAAAA